MRLTYKIIDEDYWDKEKWRSPIGKYGEFNNQLYTLQGAAKTIVRARKLDPNASFDVEGKDDTLRYTHDILAAELLHLEALTHYFIGRNHLDDAFATATQEWPSGQNTDLKYWLKSRNRAEQSQKDEAKQPFLNAAKAAEKALVYCPNRVPTLNLLAKIYIHTDRHKRRVRDVLRKSHVIDPEDLDTLQLAGEYNVSL
jgi:hypothetical protein